jgi:type IV pilus assembly protein PilM
MPSSAPPRADVHEEATVGRTAIGLDIGTSSVRAAELALRASGPELLRFGQIALPEGALRDGEVVDQAAVAGAIRELWAGVKFSHKRVSVGVANPRVVVRQVEVPYLVGDELRRALPLLVGDQVPIDASQAVMDFAPLEEIRTSDGGRSLSGLLVAGVEEMIVRSVDAVLAAGLQPRVVDLNSFAVLRAVAASPGLGLNARPEAVVDIGADLTNIVVHENGIPRFVRILLIGGQATTRALVEELGLTRIEAEQAKREVGLLDDGTPGAGPTRSMGRAANDLIEEIRGSLDYFAATSPAGPVTRVILTGGGARLRGLDERLAERLRVPVLTGSPLAGLSVGSTGLSEAQLRFIDPIAAVPVGLALGSAA